MEKTLNGEMELLFLIKTSTPLIQSHFCDFYRMLFPCYFIRTIFLKIGISLISWRAAQIIPKIQKTVTTM